MHLKSTASTLFSENSVCDQSCTHSLKGKFHLHVVKEHSVKTPCLSPHKLLQKKKIILCFREIPKMTLVETFQITHQISIRSLRKAKDFFALLVVNEVLSCTFLGSLEETPNLKKYLRDLMYYNASSLHWVSSLTLCKLLKFALTKSTAF